MQSSNPVFRRSEGFNGRTTGGQTYAGNGITYPAYGSQPTPPPGYSDPNAWGSGYGQDPRSATGLDQGRMTIDSVVQKTALTMGVVVLVAAATWWLTGEVDDQETASTLYLLSMVGALGGF